MCHSEINPCPPAPSNSEPFFPGLACSGKRFRFLALSGTDQFWEGQGQGSCLSLCLLRQPSSFVASEVGFLVGLFPGADTSFGRDVSILLLPQITPLALTGCPGNKGWHQAPVRQSRGTKGQGPREGRLEASSLVLFLCFSSFSPGLRLILSHAGPRHLPSLLSAQQSLVAAGDPQEEEAE